MASTGAGSTTPTAAQNRPELQTALETLGLPKDTVIEEADEHDVFLAVREKRKCDSCRLTPEQAVDCGKKHLKIENGRTHISCSMCSKGKAFLAQREADRLVQSSGIGQRFKRRRFDTFKPERGTEAAFRVCREFCRDYNSTIRGIRLTGPYGSGKTHLAAAVLNEMLNRGVAGIFLVVPDLLRQIRLSYDDKETAARVNKLIDMAQTIPILVLDDLGAEKTSDWVREQLFILLNARYERELPTIITTNYTTDALLKKIGQRIMSRLVEMTTAVTLQAADYRLRKQA